jgi:diacylglycerol kinase family enzyme
MNNGSQVALVVNRNARRVNDRVIQRLHDWLPEHQVYTTSTKEESESAIREILDHGYSTVFAGGGDGTVVDLINTISREVGDRTWPRIGVLRLGTGNALAHMVSTGTPEDDLRAFLTQDQRDDMPISLITDDSKTLFPFSGFGLDAQILNDYNSVKNSLGKTFMGPVVKNVGGYFLAAFTRTIPRRTIRALQRKKLSVRITTRGDQAFSLGENGIVQKYYGPDEVIYEGPTSMLAMGTTPYYGYGMKILPYARRYPSMFHVRTVDASIAKTLAILPEVWKGTYNGPCVRDFAVESIKVEFSEPMPYQIAGDAVGLRQELEVSVAPQPVHLIRLI